MTTSLIRGEREFLTLLSWGGGSSLSRPDVESKLKQIHYKKIGGVEELKAVMGEYASHATDPAQKQRLLATVDELNSLSKEKHIILDKLVKLSWIPDPAIYAHLPPKGAEGFSFLTTDGFGFKVLSFRGYSNDEINFFDNDKVPASFIILHEARHLNLELANGAAKSFTYAADPDNRIQKVTEEAYSSYLPASLLKPEITDKTKAAFPTLTALGAYYDDANTYKLTTQMQFSPSVLAGEMKADSFAALMASNDPQQYKTVVESVSQTRRKAFKEHDVNHFTAGALENSSYVQLKSLPQAMDVTNQRAQTATIQFISQHPEYNPEVTNAFNLCNAAQVRDNILEQRNAMMCVNSKLSGELKP